LLQPVAVGSDEKNEVTWDDVGQSELEGLKTNDADLELEANILSTMKCFVAELLVLTTTLSAVSGFVSVAVPSRRPESLSSSSSSSSSALSAAPTMVIY
jgi:hypothetical protein